MNPAHDYARNDDTCMSEIAERRVAPSPTNEKSRIKTVSGSTSRAALRSDTSGKGVG